MKTLSDILFPKIMAETEQDGGIVSGLRLGKKAFGPRIRRKASDLRRRVRGIFPVPAPPEDPLRSE